MKLRVSLALLCALVLSACASMNGGAPDKYIVFFDFDSVELSRPALAVVAKAAAEAKRANPTRIDVAGYTGAVEGARTGEVIATQRFEAVANARATDRMQEMAERHKLEGVANWMRVIAAIGELQKSKDGERTN